MARYEVTFVIDTDLQSVGTQPWWPIIGEEPMPVEWLEYILVCDLTPEEYVLDVQFEENTINLIDMTGEAHEILMKEAKPNHLSLVVDNDDDENKLTSVPEKE